jgi:hypothetical protein
MFKQFTAAAALALAALSSFAAPAGFYDGVDLGFSKIDDVDGRRTSVGLLLGYGFNRAIALELGYRMLGRVELYGVDVTTKQAHLSFVGSLPLNQQFDIYARAGYNNIRADASGGGHTYSDDISGRLHGIGVSANFDGDLYGRLEVQRPASDLTNVSISLVYKF